MNLTLDDLPGRVSRRAAKTWRAVRAAARTPVLGVANRVSTRPLVDDASSTVVSLTSYSTRLRTVHLTIESIGLGRARPGRLILWVDPGVDVDQLCLPLQRLKERGLEIKLSSGDYGPHKKYFPFVMSEAPHRAMLVTADDDCLYPRHWLQDLETAASLHPDEIVCHRAHRVRFGADGELAPYNSWGPVMDQDASVVNFATGVSGVGYPPAFLDELEALGDEFQARCPRADDIWLHYNAVRHGWRIRQIGRRPQKYPELLSTQQTALHRTNTAQSANDTQIRATYTPDVLETLRGASVAS